MLGTWGSNNEGIMGGIGPEFFSLTLSRQSTFILTMGAWWTVDMSKDYRRDSGRAEHFLHRKHSTSHWFLRCLDIQVLSNFIHSLSPPCLSFLIYPPTLLQVVGYLWSANSVTTWQSSFHFSTFCCNLSCPFTLFFSLMGFLKNKNKKLHCCDG